MRHLRRFDERDENPMGRMVHADCLWADCGGTARNDRVVVHLMPETWYSYREVAFHDPDCIIWIAEHISTLEDGRWPPPPPGHRVSDGPILPPEPKTKPKNKHYEPMRGREASFCRPEAIAAEFRRRFELVTGSRTAEHDRILFEEHFINDIDTWRLARIKGMPPWDVDRRINRVLKFLTGKGLHYIDGHVANYTEWMHKRRAKWTQAQST